MSETRTFVKQTVLKFLKSGLQTLTVMCFTIGGSTNESKTFQHEKKFLLSKEILVNLVFLGQIGDCVKFPTNKQTQIFQMGHFVYF